MKKHTSGVQVGLWVAAGLLGLYVLGGALLYFEAKRGGFLFTKVPEPVLDALGAIYSPAFWVIFYLWPELNPVDLST